MKFPPFDYVRPETVEEALEAVAVEDARVLSGGQSLMPVLALGLAHPSRLVDVSRLAELRSTRFFRADRTLTIGAAVPHADLLAGADGGVAPFLQDIARFIGHPAIRARGTLGGSIAHADPAAEWPALATALDATVTLESAHGLRQLPAAEFLQGPYMTALEPGELLTSVTLDLSRNPVVEFDEVARRPGDFALAGVVAVATGVGTAGVDASGAMAGELSVTVFGATSAPTRLDALPMTFTRAGLPDAWESVRAGLAALDRYNGDVHAAPEVRRYLTRRLARTVLDRLWARLERMAA
jgi:CO/xanthine dehydrogenase FAD-binding subunit